MLTDINYYLSYLEKISTVYITVIDFSLQIETVFHWRTVSFRPGYLPCLGCCND